VCVNEINNNNTNKKKKKERKEREKKKKKIKQESNIIWDCEGLCVDMGPVG